MHLGIEGECEPCPRGTYRTQGIEPACQQCPAGRTTKQSGASSIEECSLPICVPGKNQYKHNEFEHSNNKYIQIMFQVHI